MIGDPGVVCLPPRSSDAEAADRAARLYLLLKRISDRVHAERDRVDSERANLHPVAQEDAKRV